jgi:fructose-1,6-bisphosphatase/inositol monophosphatase family enzyme
MVGAVYFAAWDELFSAAAGMGATLNRATIRVSGVTQMEQALFATPQAPASPDRLAAFTTRMTKLAPCVEGFRMPGAQSVMVCGVAAGRYDITAGLSTRSTLPSDRPYFGQPWETAAFVVLVQEAGGLVASSSGGPPDLLNYNIYAASPELVREYVALMEGS